MRKALHWLWLIASIGLIAGGVVAICRPGATLLSLAWVIGASMLFEGLCSIAMYFQIGWRIPGSGWYLLDGLATTILAFFLLCNNLFTASALPYLLGMWIIVMGIERILQSMDAKRMGDKEWGLVLALGIVAVVIGIMSFVNPVISTVTISIAVGIFLILHGVSNIILWAADHKAKRFLRRRAPDIPEVDAKDVSSDGEKQK